MATANLSALTG